MALSITFSRWCVNRKSLCLVAVMGLCLHASDIAAVRQLGHSKAPDILKVESTAHKPFVPLCPKTEDGLHIQGEMRYELDT